MIESDTLEKIKKRCADAGLGYATITSHIYAKDVAALLKDREELLSRCSLLQGQLENVLGTVNELPSDVGSARD